MFFDRQFFEKALPKAQILFDCFPQDFSFSIDSRTLFPGDVFIALSGNRVDAHDYVKEVLQKKDAGGVIIDRLKKDCLKGVSPSLLKNKLVIVVDNVLESLQSMAATWRQQWDFPVIGLTGSLGKTVTRERLGLLFKNKGISYISSSQNLNSIIGLPLSILKMRDHHELAVFEMGISCRNEMYVLADVLKPTIGVITGIGHSHLEGLGSLSDIAIEKRNVFKNFNEDNIGIINGDQPQLSNVSYTHPVIKFGLKTTNQIQARKIQVGHDSIEFILKIYQKKYAVCLPTNHEGAIMSSLVVAAVGSLLNIDHDLIVKTVESNVLVSGRYQPLPLKEGNGIVINDCYNASPESMKMALLAFDKMDVQSEKIAVIGDMLELGIDTAFWHRQLGRFLRKTPSIKHVILVGKHVEAAQTSLPQGVRSELVSTAKEALLLLQQYITKDRSVALFVKGSNALRLSVVVDGLIDAQERFSGAKRTVSMVSNKNTDLSGIEVG